MTTARLKPECEAEIREVCMRDDRIRYAENRPLSWESQLLAELDAVRAERDAFSEGFKRNLRAATAEIRAERDAAVKVAEAARALSHNLNDTPGDDFNVVADALDVALAAWSVSATTRRSDR